MVKTHEVRIEAAASTVWAALTRPELMAQWMAEPEMHLEVSTDWSVGGSITMTGKHHARFVNRGAVRCFEPPLKLRYSHLSSLSRLPDVPESYSELGFELRADGSATVLTVTLSGFPNEGIEKHLDFYWRGTVGVLKRFIEQR